MRMLNRHEILNEVNGDNVRHVRKVVAGAIVAALLTACQTPEPIIPSAPTATPSSQPAPVITVAPDRITSGGQLNVIGFDWQAGEQVTLGLISTVPVTGTGSIVLATLTADSQGRFQLVTNMPAQVAPGVWQVYAQTRTPGRFATATLTVLVSIPTPGPQPTLAPPTFTPVPTRIVIVPTRQPPPPQRPTATPVAPTPVPTTIVLPPFPDWRAEYYSNLNLAGAPVIIRNDATIEFNWGYGPPDSRIPPDNFSVRWTRVQQFEPGTYRFTFRVDDGIRLFVDNVLVLDDWRDAATRDVSTDLTLAGRPYSYRIEYYERFGLSTVRMNVARLPLFTPSPIPTSLPTASSTPTPIPTAIILPSATPIPIPTQIPPLLPTATPTPVPLPTVTFTAIPLPTATRTNPPSATPVPLPTNTSTPIPVSTATATATPLPATATATATPVPIPTSTPTASNTPTPEPTATSTNTAIPLPTDTPTTEPTGTPTAEPTSLPTASSTPAPEATATPTLEPSATPTDETATPTPTATATRPVSPTETVTATLTLSNLRLRVQGRGWTPGERVTVYLSDDPEGAAAVQLGRPTVNQNGRFNLNRTLIQAPSGPIYVIVTNPAGAQVIEEVAIVP